MLALALDGLPPVDYSKSTTQVYEEFVRATIISSRRFWPATVYFWRPQVSSSFPSWIPDLSAESSTDVSLGILMSEVHRWFDDDEDLWETQDVIVDLSLDHGQGKIALRGLRYGTVESSDMIWSMKSQSWLIWLSQLWSWMRFCQQHSVMELDPGGQPAPFWELREFFVKLRQEDQQNAFRVAFFRLADWYECCHAANLTPFNEPQTEHWIDIYDEHDFCKFFFTDAMSLQESVLFSTSVGTIGVTTGFFERGDVVALLFGSNYPIILRREGDEWRCIGASYVPAAISSDFWPLDENSDSLETFILK